MFAGYYITMNTVLSICIIIITIAILAVSVFAVMMFIELRLVAKKVQRNLDMAHNVGTMAGNLLRGFSSPLSRILMVALPLLTYGIKRGLHQSKYSGGEHE